MNTIPVPEVKELCPWEKQLAEAVLSPEIFARTWNSIPEPKRECVVYDWPENEVN